jgi:hypothetical protein
MSQIDSQSKGQLGLKRIQRCSGTLAVTRWRTEGTTRGRCRLTSDTTTSSTRYATQKCRLPALRTFGGPNPHLEAWISQEVSKPLRRRALNDEVKQSHQPADLLKGPTQVTLKGRKWSTVGINMLSADQGST